MPTSPTKVCLICGFDDCETADQSRTVVKMPGVRDQAEQIRAAASLLNESKSTLICGLDRLSLDAQMAAWKLADRTRSIIDTSFAEDSRAVTQAIQRYGKVSATYGEIASRCDLIVFWDCDLQRQPCLLKMLKAGPMPDRKIVFVGDADSPMVDYADCFFSMDVSKDRNAMVRLVCRLRAQIAHKELAGDRYEDNDLPFVKVRELYDLLAGASYSSLFFGANENDWEFDLETESLMRFVSEFNSISPLVGMKVRDDRNALGAEKVLASASGFPGAISLQRGYAECNGATYSAGEVLRRSACDTILIFGNVVENGVTPVPDWVTAELEGLTVIQLAPRSEAFADVFIACPVIEFKGAFAGKVLRGDGVMLSGADSDPDNSAELILESLLTAVHTFVTA